jgi:hydrogenase 3 maturation protease
MAETRRVVFLGIGHPLRRDDAAGVEVCTRLRPALHGRSDVLVVDGGSAPENCIGALRAFAPDVVVIIDAARMGELPGTLLRIDPSDPRAAGASTHTLPLPTFCAYLEETLRCDVTLLGIEPADTSFGEGLTPTVERAVERAARLATAELSRDTAHSGVVESTTAPRPHPLTPSPLRGGEDAKSNSGEGEGLMREWGELCSPHSLQVLTPPPEGIAEVGLSAHTGGGAGVGVRRHYNKKERTP